MCKYLPSEYINHEYPGQFGNLFPYLKWKVNRLAVTQFISTPYQRR
jgi:hypothetical protein